MDLGGATAFAVVPETGALDSNVFTNATERAHWTALRDEFGVRYYRGFSDSLFSEWVFNSGELSGSLVDSLIVTHPCNANRGWSTDDPTAGVCENDTNIACTDNFPANAAVDACGLLLVPACATNIGNPQNAVGCPNNCIPTEFCWQQAEPLGTRGFLWSRDIAAGELTDTNKSLVVAAGGDISGKCPPDCGLDYFWNVFEQEAIDNLLATPEKPGAPQLPDPNFRILPNIGFQAAFDHYSGGTAGKGDTLAIILVFSQFHGTLEQPASAFSVNVPSLLRLLRRPRVDAAQPRRLSRDAPLSGVT